MELTCPTCGDVLGSYSTVCYRCSPEAEYRPQVQQRAQSAPARPTSGAEVIGIMVVVLGFILMFGNMTGLFPTFPFAGFILMLIGGGISKLGD
jgi:hypothetical protein